jgi:hypothetical protein
MAKTFVRTERASKELKGQAALVLEALDAAEGPQTVEQLTATIKDLGLVTRQAPERITSYYLCIFKKQGLVRVVEPEPSTDESVDEPSEVAAEA